jgi:hypothetical protein
VVLSSWAYHHIKESGRQEIREQRAKEREQEKKRTDKLKEDADHDWQTKVDTLQTRIDSLLVTPGPAIRLCKPAAKVRLPDAAPIADEIPTDTGSTLQAGRDIGKSLILYGGDCERTREQLTDLQAWIRGVTGDNSRP